MIPSGAYTAEQWGFLLNMSPDRVCHGANVSLGLGYGGLTGVFVRYRPVPCSQFGGGRFGS